VKLPRKLEVKLCKNCLRYLRKGHWTFVSDRPEKVLEDAAFNAIEDSLIIEELKNAKVNIAIDETKQSSRAVSTIYCSIEIEGNISGINYQTLKKTEVRAKFDLCQDCSRQIGGYYESILQIRGEDLLSKEEKERIRNTVDKVIASLSGKDRKAFISTIKHLKEGVDFYVGSTQVARKIANALREEFGGKLSESPKLVGQDKQGKALHRVNIALRLPRFKEKDIIELQGQVFQLIGLTRGKVAAFDLVNRKKTSLPAKSLKDARIIGRKKDIIKAMVSEVIPGRIQVMDLTNYETLYFENLEVPLKIKDEVEIFRKGKDYLLMLGEEK
jgi:nonsense-mediated mRNA decay protein 3